MSDDKKNERALTLKQKRFVEAVADPKTKSRTQAALVAGYGKGGAPQRASENVKKRNVALAIKKQEKEALDKARALLPSIERLLRQAVKDLEEKASKPMDVVTAAGIAELAGKLQRGQLEIQERYPDAMGDDTDRDSLRRQARSIQLVMLHVLEAAIARPEVANRMLHRLRGKFAVEEPEIEEQANDEPPSPTEGRWSPGRMRET